MYAGWTGCPELDQALLHMGPFVQTIDAAAAAAAAAAALCKLFLRETGSRLCAAQASTKALFTICTPYMLQYVCFIQLSIH
ncbi:unnamed protein product [Heligmosomoides polygyrus]|uniref:Uncharacterized protein n=1 Tax=Heligmosomoides polygyrus TaxID=6339 RepID=A0A183G690_HELPZ|nr:unnamed protein product [Heligmosomoides polygyrus]